MAKLKGSIKEIYDLNGSVKTEGILQGSIKKVYSLFGSVENFLRSLTIRIFLQPIANIYTSAVVDRYMKVRINAKSNIFTRAMAFRNIKELDIISRSNIKIGANVDKNAKFEIKARPIFGKDSTLELFDNLTLDQMDELTLGEMEFTEGVYANVIKNSSFNLFGIAEVTTTAIVIRYTKLDDIDEMTLDELDELTLIEIEEMEV